MKSAAKIPFFWKIALSNSMLANLFSQEDLELLASLQNLSSNVTKNSIDLTLVFGENPRIKKGKYTRKLILDGPMPVSIEGDKVEWISGSYEGVMPSILNDSKDE